MKYLLIFMLLLNQGFANSVFKATFVDEQKKEVKTEDVKETEAKTEVKPEAPAQKKIQSAERIIESGTCLSYNGVENCPLNSVICKENIEYSNGIAKKHTKKIVNETEFGGCSEDYVLNKGMCEKTYHYYTYSCGKDRNENNIEWKGPLISTGEDCLGKGIKNGESCNLETPPEKNCFREAYSCPTGGKCTKMKGDRKEPNTFNGMIFSQGSSKVVKKEVSVPKEEKCPSGTVEKNGICLKSYSFYEYECPVGYDIKEKGFDCLGLGIQNDFCNSITPPENNCSKMYVYEDNEELSYKTEVTLKDISINGEFGDNSVYYGFNDKYNEMEFIYNIYGNGNELCFKNKSEESCFEFQGCSFKGEIRGIVKNIDVKDNGFTALNQTISTNCAVFGNIGDKTRESGITAISAVGNVLKFYDAFLDKDLGELAFFEQADNVSYLKIKDFNILYYKNGFTYTASNSNNCESIAKKHNLSIVDSKDSEYYRAGKKEADSYYVGDKTCVLKKAGNFTPYAKNKVSKVTKTDKGFNVYKCSNIPCENGECSTASCPKGFVGNIYTEGAFASNIECKDDVCNANKPYSLYCNAILEN